MKYWDRNGVLRTKEWMEDKYWPLLDKQSNQLEPGWDLVGYFETADTPDALKWQLDKNVAYIVAPPSILAAQKKQYKRWAEQKARGIEATSALMAVLWDSDGNPVGGIEVAFYWEDATYDPQAGPKYGVIEPQMFPDRCVHGPTEGDGDVGFGMGGGAWVEPGEMGPHGLWAYGDGTNSAVAFGFGMKFGTPHDHMNAVFQWRPEAVEPGDCPVEDVVAILDTLDKRADNIIAAAKREKGDTAAIRALFGL